MPLCRVFGTIMDAAGNGVVDVPVLLSPAPVAERSPEAIGGIGVVLDPVEVVSDADGEFEITALQGFRVRLKIDALGFDEVFTVPVTDEIRFDLVGLVPVVGQAKDYVDGDGDQHVTTTVLAPRVQVVLERFDSLIVERAPEKVGPWTEVDTIDLVSGTDTYTVDDVGTSAQPDGYYRARYLNTDNLDESTSSDPQPGGADDDALVLSVSELKQIYLFGIDLTDEDGNPFPQLMFERYIRAATRLVEHALDIRVVAHDIVEETHDHYASDYGQWGYFQLHEFPTIRIDKVAFRYPSMTDEVVISDEWIVLCEEGAHGVVQIVPGQGNIADVLLIPGALMPLWSGATGRVPGVWRFDYRAGFEVDEIPEDIQHIVGMIASLGVMNVAGDLVGGSGLQGWSVSIPGLSQNVTTTNSSTNAGFGARVLEYGKEIKQMWPILKQYYGKTIKMRVA